MGRRNPKRASVLTDETISNQRLEGGEYIE